MPPSASCRSGCPNTASTDRREALRRLGHVAYVLLPGLLLGYLVMGLIWPWSIIDPANPFRALTYFSHFFEKPWKELFDGAIVSVRTCRGRICRRCSRSSFRKCCSPCSAPVSSQTFASLVRAKVDPRRKTILLMLTLAATLPLVIAMVKRPALYNGIRISSSSFRRWRSSPASPSPRSSTG